MSTAVSGVTVTFELITPELAEQYLGLNIDDNRKFNDRHANSLERDMLQGNFRPTPNGIGFNEEGRLIDGQHRLSAIINSEEPQELAVFRNLPDKSMRNIDTGKGRTVQDELYRQGATNRRTITSATRLLMAYEDHEVGVEGLSSTKYTNDEVLEYVSIWTESIDLALPAANLIKRNVGVTPSVVCAAHVLFSNKDPEMCTLFMHSLATGENLSSGDPVLVIRNRFQSENQRSIRRRQSYTLYAVIRAWNAVRLGERLTRLYVPDSHSGKHMLAVR